MEQTLSPHAYAIRTTTPKFVDTTLAPADELLWLCTTLCYRENSGWEVLEFCEAIGELPGGIDEEIVFRHLSRRILWLQEMISNGEVRLGSVSGHFNPADIGTKRLAAGHMPSLMSVLGLYNKSSGALEGEDDPGRVFVRRYSIRAIASGQRLEPATASTSRL